MAQAAAEFLGHRIVGQIGDVADHARQLEPARRHHAVRVVMAAVEFGVGEDGLARDLVEGDVLCGELGRGGDHRHVADTIGKLQRPRQRLHAAERAANHRGEALDAEAVGQAGLRLHPVFHGDEGEVRAPQRAGGGVDLVGAGRAIAAAEVVHPDHEELARIERLARADEVVPPAHVVRRVGVGAGDVVRTRQRVAHQHRVAALGVERAVGLIDQVVVVQRATAAQRERFGELGPLRRDHADRLRGDHCRHLQKQKTQSAEDADWVPSL